MNNWNGLERRKNRRIDKELHLEYKVVSLCEDKPENYDKFHNADIKNLSTGGALILTRNKIQKYSLLEIRLSLNTENIILKAKVIRIEEENRNYNIAMRFLSFRNSSHEMIGKIIGAF